MEQTVSFKCNCGAIVMVKQVEEIVKCFECGKPWRRSEWQKFVSLHPVDPNEMQNATKNLKSPGKKAMPATRMLEQEELQQIKEESKKEVDSKKLPYPSAPLRHEGKPEQAKATKPPLPATMMFSIEEIEEIKKASIEKKEKKK